MSEKDEYIDMIMGPVMRSSTLLTTVISMKRTQITSLLLSHNVYPEVEMEARTFSVLQCQQKTASFTAYDLAQFIDKRYHEITNY